IGATVAVHVGKVSAAAAVVGPVCPVPVRHIDVHRVVVDPDDISATVAIDIGKVGAAAAVIRAWDPGHIGPEPTACRVVVDPLPRDQAGGDSALFGERGGGEP